MDSPSLNARSASLGINSGRSNRNAFSDTSSAGSNDKTSTASNKGGESVLAMYDSASRQNHAMTRQGSADHTTTSAPVDPRAQEATEAAQQRFADAASDHDAFHATMQQAFGANYDYAKAEAYRQQALEGDFSWMPKIEVVSQAELTDQSGQQTSGTALGAYSAETDTIYISEELLANDPERAVEIMLEEMGHALDVRLNETDSAGDEGDIFAQLISGENLSQEELEALRAENDSGTIVIDGKEIEVEYGCNPIKAVVDVFKAPFEALASIVESAFDVLGDMWESLKDAVIKVLNHPIFQAILMIASFIPIPIVQLVVRVIQIIKAVYAIAQGIKHGSMSMVLSGIASLATGAANLGAMVGASKSFIETANNVATWAGNAAKIYKAVAAEDFGEALSLASSAFTGTELGSAFGIAEQAYGVYEAVDEGDVLGALQLGSDLIGDLNGGETPELLDTLMEHAGNFSAVYEAVESGDYQLAANTLMENYGDTVGLSEAQQERVGQIAGAVEMVDGARTMIDDGNYAGAAIALFASAEQFGVSDTARAHLTTAAEKVSQLAEIAMLIGRGEYSEAVALGAKVLDSNPSEEMQKRVDELVLGVDRIENAVAAAESGHYALAAGFLSEAAGMPLSSETKSTLSNIEGRVETAKALYDAVEAGDVTEALAALDQLTGLALPEQIAATVEGIQNAVEQVEELKDAIDNGQYAIAADTAANLADMVEADDVASSLRSLSALLQRLGFAAPGTATNTAAYA